MAIFDKMESLSWSDMLRPDGENAQTHQDCMLRRDGKASDSYGCPPLDNLYDSMYDAQKPKKQAQVCHAWQRK